ncbi:MAG TPA: LuxR C-terminal-related transcriptional regulator [Acidimicrobiales bacterium]|nr:LuxR C-terminal-related transcriptional regulator [Acidimicrobiales bacterium]
MRALEDGRAAFARQAFDEAFTLLAAADGQSPLDVDDLDRLAEAAFLSGHEHEGDEVLARVSRLAVAQGEPAKAARAAFWLALSLLSRGEYAQGGGWLARAARTIEDAGLDCVEQGYLLIPAGIQSFEEGDVAGAAATFDRAAKIGHRFHDHDLVALSALGKGSSLVWLGESAEGVALLDEAMVSVIAGEVTPIVAGIVYCGVIEACWDLFDVGRAAEWTAALSRWCASMPDQLPYRGQCRIHRSEILQLRGEWREAEEEARLAGRRLEGWPSGAAAYYQEAEVLRLRGRFTEAEDAYRRADEAGRVPQPGLARLRLAQGRVDAAAAGIRRVLDEAESPVARARLLGAYVDVMLAAGDEGAARAGATELAAIAADMRSTFLSAAAAYAEGAVLLAAGNCTAACATLRRSLEAWRTIEAPYEVARVRILLGLACRGVGDEDAAQMERDAATRAFRQLGARPELDAADRRWNDAAETSPTGGLTAREVEVLALVATGRTNKAIASELVISEKTVARHLSNIFTKLGLTSRAAATAYAYENGLA